MRQVLWREFQKEIQSELTRNLFPNHFASFRINSKNILNLVRCKSIGYKSDSIWEIKFNESELSFQCDSKWMNRRSSWPKRNFQFKLFRSLIYSNWKFGLDQLKLGLILFNSHLKLRSDSFSLKSRMELN